MMSMLKRAFKYCIAHLLLAGTLVMNLYEPLISRRPWFAALMVGTLATPAAVIIAWLAPRPLDAVVALPLVLIDMWAASAGAMGNPVISNNEGPLLQLLLLVLGIVLTWLFYVFVARFVIWRLAAKSS